MERINSIDPIMSANAAVVDDKVELIIRRLIVDKIRSIIVRNVGRNVSILIRSNCRNYFREVYND